MSDIEQPVVDLFLALQRSMAVSDAPGVALLFAPQFLDANPTETRMRTNDEAFVAAMEERLAYLLLAGMRDVKALAIDPTPLGAGYALVRVRWSVWFTPAGRAEFVDEFLFDYVVHRTVDRVEIAVSIAHDTDEEIMCRIGLAG
jgi:hypothetical protein